jgi:hypothetical protein
MSASFKYLRNEEQIYFSRVQYSTIGFAPPSASSFRPAGNFFAPAGMSGTVSGAGDGLEKFIHDGINLAILYPRPVLAKTTI